MHMWGVGCIGEISVNFSQFCCEPKIPLKIRPLKFLKNLNLHFSKEDKQIYDKMYHIIKFQRRATSVLCTYIFTTDTKL